MQQSPSDPHRLTPSDLRYTCDPSEFDFETTDELPPLDGVIGQQRAVQAIEFGLAMKSFGYNLYAAGIPGTGKKTLVRALVERIAREKPSPPDLFYVHNFENPDYPRILRAPAGMASQLKRDLQELVDTLKEEVPKAFKSEEYQKRRGEILQDFQKRRAQEVAWMQQQAAEKGMAIRTGESVIMTIPLVEGKELSGEEFAQLPPQEQEELRRRQKEVTEKIQQASQKIRALQQDTQEQMRELDRRAALIVTAPLLLELRQRYGEQAEILDYLKEIQQDILDHVEDFLVEEGEDAELGVLALRRDRPGLGLKRYAVNVLVDNSRQEHAPVVVESHPTYRNLVGFLEREARMGTLYTDFTMIRAGSALRANGGYLILDLVDLLLTPFVWESLKRILQNREVKIEDVSEQFGFVATAGLRPEPVQVDLKVILLGSPELYSLLYQADEDFQKLFKIKADFDTVLKRTPEHLQQYARYIKRLCDEESLKAFQRDGVAAVIEQSARMVGDQTRLSLRFSDVADLIRESDFWASRNGHDRVGRADVEQAIREKIYRSNLVEERLQELIEEGTILIRTQGEAVGQINGLSVFQLGDFGFGKPTRITAQMGVGNRGVVNVEREARLSGRIHDKGVLILSGYLTGTYGQKFPLSLHASLCFEQYYSDVDGDSASSAELYALLSSLAEVPLRQGLAVTGSINQMGLIQPIGGVNEKIEGFFRTCRPQGLTGDQGVIIPQQNRHHLMLPREVIEAVEQGVFHIYSIETVDQGLEILTGLPAGERQPDGSFPSGSLHDRVQRRLAEMAESIRAHRGRDQDNRSA